MLTELPLMVSSMSAATAYALRRGIAAERARLGLSQRQLADRLGWSRSRLANIETGITQITAGELPEICAALGVTLGKLVLDAPEEERRALGL